jgi:hypothetical protein
MKILKLKHWVNKKNQAVKLGAEASNGRITLTIKHGREEYGKWTDLSIAEALLLSDWLREAALALLRSSEEVEEAAPGWVER